MIRPNISIITICFNAENTIESTIRSVCSQTYPSIEYVIVDGASVDKTLEIIDRYSSKISKIISEKDGGIYDAMNKGLSLVTGDIVYFLNADDRFCDNEVLSDIAKAFEEDSSRDLIYGKVRPENVPDYYKPFILEFFVIKSVKDFLRYTICHQAIFAKRSLFEKIGNFNCRYRYSADYEWQIRAYKFNPQGFYFLNRDICNFHYIGRSHQHLKVTNKENSIIRFKYLFSLKFIWRYFRYDLIRGLKKRLLGEEK